MKLRMLSVLFAAIFAAPALAASSVQSFDTETVGAEPKSFTAAVGNWVIVDNGGNKALSVNGSQWARGQTSAGLADKARALYGERYAEFLDNVQSYAYFPIAVMNEVKDFREGTITVRFKGVAGRIDQAAGILFDVKSKGNLTQLTVRKFQIHVRFCIFQGKFFFALVCLCAALITLSQIFFIKLQGALFEKLFRIRSPFKIRILENLLLCTEFL